MRTYCIVSDNQGKQECDERTRKKAEKRKRRKQARREGELAAKQAKLSDAKWDGAKNTSGSGGGSDSGGSGSDGNVAEEFVYIPVADQAASGGDGGAPAAYKNDGSFLAKMKAELGLNSDGAGDKAVPAK